MSFRQFLSIIRRRWYAVLFCLLTGVGGAVVYIHARTVTYRSTAEVDYQPPRGQTGQLLFNLANPIAASRGPAVTNSAARALGISSAEVSHAELPVSYSLSTNLVRISAQSESPTQAAAIANAIAKAYVANVRAGVAVGVTRIVRSRTSVLSQIQKLESTKPKAAANAASPIGAEIAVLTQTVASLTSEVLQVQNAGPNYALIQSYAARPRVPVGTKSSEVLLLGVIAGLLVGIALALLWEHLDETVVTDADLRGVTDLPVLAELRTERRAKSGPTSVVLLDRPNSAVSDSLRELRTSSWVAAGGGEGKAILVTSPAPRDGKTFVAANLAVAHASVGRRVVVVSADLVSRRIERVLGVAGAGYGLADLIQTSLQTAADERVLTTSTGEQLASESRYRGSESSTAGNGRSWGPKGRSVHSCLVRSEVAGVSVLPAGRATQTSEVLAGDAMRGVIAELGRHFDLTIVDTRAVLTSSDAAALSPMVDGVIVVISSGLTDAPTLDRTLERLEGTRGNVLGVVLNRVKRSSSATFHPLRQRRVRLH